MGHRKGVSPFFAVHELNSVFLTNGFVEIFMLHDILV
jgi:hypothetical protein